jgi:uncharacterized membrane protein YfcA
VIEPEVLLPFGGVVLVSYLVQTATGFGAMIVAVTFGALVLEIETIVAIAVPLSIVQNIWIAARHHDGIDRRLLFITILPVMGTGMVAGFLMSEAVAGNALRVAFGVLVLLLASRELWVSFHDDAPQPKPLGRLGTAASILGAGILHGIYATGGPLLVYAIGRLELGKHAFRSTLTSVWLLLNLVLTGMLVYAGRISTETITVSALMLPSVPIGLVVGQIIHDRVDEQLFRRLLFGLLAIAAIPLIVR